MRLAHIQIVASLSLGLVAGWGLPQPWRTYVSEKQRVLGLQDSKYEEQRWSQPGSLFGDNEAHPHRPRVGFVALGDSYSAGIGTGVEGKETNCRRGLGAYPQLIATDLAASHGRPNRTSFQFLSCTGARTEDILSSSKGRSSAAKSHQIDALNASRPVDFALLTVGGNDLGFFDVMNACIFRFYNFYSGTCKTALARAEQRLEDRAFDERLHILITELLDKVRWERKSPGFHITVTGYAQFFNDRTEPCDDMSLGIWLGPSRGGP
ncbi:Lipase 1-like protein 3 [Apiospora saccharicola]